MTRKERDQRDEDRTDVDTGVTPEFIPTPEDHRLTEALFPRRRTPRRSVPPSLVGQTKVCRVCQQPFTPKGGEHTRAWRARETCQRAACGKALRQQRIGRVIPPRHLPAWVLGVCLVGSSPASAGILTPGLFSTPSGPPAAFWNNPSWDGPGQNVGEQFTGVGPGAPQGLLPWLNMSGAASPFTVTDGLDLEVTLVSETSSYAGVNRFGWFAFGLPDWGELFGGAAGPGASAFLPPVAYPQIGFWLVAGDGGFYTSVDHGWQFALFQESPTTYLLGVEDLDLRRRSDRDYNDLVVRLRFETEPPEPPGAVPEPGTLTLLGVGCLGLARRWRRG